MMAWALEQHDRCPRGHYLWEWEMDGSGPYEEQLVKCHACSKLENRLRDNRQQSRPETYAGRYTRLINPLEVPDGDSS